ncbi:MAG: glycosyltransferase [candidate division Zixibacteria bacterium]|nr:glycosyltransferase [candidate division Zixibacteria bacterium]
MKKISILHIVLSTVTGGMENVIYNLASGRDHSRYDISVGCLNEMGHLSEKLKSDGVESFLIPKMIPGISMFYPRQLIKFIKKSGCDIVHTHSGCWAKVAAACAQISSVKLIYTEHGRTFPDPKFMIWQDRLAIRSTDMVVTVGDTLKEYMVDTVGLPAEKVMTIFNGIDTDRFKPSEDIRKSVRNEFGYSDENVVISIVARLAPVKNHRFLIDAFSEVVRKHPEARLLIIGDGPLRPDLESQASSLNLNDKINFAGDRIDVPRLLTGADISTLSSVSEGISLTLLEAMSTALPVVATDVGGNSTIIKNNVLGYLIPSDADKIDTYVSRFSELIISPELRQRLGNSARERVLEQWSLKGMVNDYEKLYEELVG